MAYRWPSSVLTQRSLIVAVAIIVASVLSLAIASVASSTAAASSAEIFTMAMDKMRRGGRDDADGVVEYVEVPSGEGGTMRYAAYLRRGQTTTVMSVRSWMTLVASPDGAAAAGGLSGAIASSPYPSLLFETPGTTWSASERVPFEFALVDLPPLGRFAEAGPDRGAFATHFDVLVRRRAGGVLVRESRGRRDARFAIATPQRGGRRDLFPSGEVREGGAGESGIGILAAGGVDVPRCIETEARGRREGEGRRGGRDVVLDEWHGCGVASPAHR